MTLSSMGESETGRHGMRRPKPRHFPPWEQPVKQVISLSANLSATTSRPPACRFSKSNLAVPTAGCPVLKAFRAGCLRAAASGNAPASFHPAGRDICFQFMGYHAAGPRTNCTAGQPHESESDCRAFPPETWTEIRGSSEDVSIRLKPAKVLRPNLNCENS